MEPGGVPNKGREAQVLEGKSWFELLASQASEPTAAGSFSVLAESVTAGGDGAVSGVVV